MLDESDHDLATAEVLFNDLRRRATIAPHAGGRTGPTCMLDYHEIGRYYLLLARQLTTPRLDGRPVAALDVARACQVLRDAIAYIQASARRPAWI